MVWRLIGVARLQKGHGLGSGSFSWAMAVQASVLIGVIGAVPRMLSAVVPNACAMEDIALRDAANAEYEVRVLRGGVELEVNGPIGYGLAKEVRTVLETNPGVLLIHLNSRGGRVVEARKLRDLIVERHLSTYIGNQCFSACVIAYAAGGERLIDHGAKLGLHQYSSLRPADLENEYNIDRQFLLAQGVSRQFVERAFKTPNSGVWIPTHKELLEAKLATRYAGEAVPRRPVQPSNGSGESP